MFTKIRICHIQAEQAQHELLKAYQHGCLSGVSYSTSKSLVTASFLEHTVTFGMFDDDFGCCVLEPRTAEIDNPAFRVSEGVIRMAAAMNRNGGAK